MRHKLIKIANQLDALGYYDIADKIDFLIKKSIDYPYDFDPPTQKQPEEWELELQNMEISPEAKQKEKEYRWREVQVPQEDIEKLIVKTKMLLKGTQEDGSGSVDIWQPNPDSPDIGEQWYFEEEGEPYEELVYPEDMVND